MAQQGSPSKPAPGHKIYPYLLRKLAVTRPNQVWAMDITYVPMARGFVCLAAVVDWFSRKVLSWRLSITLSADFCIEALEDALRRHGKPEIFNTDQGSQFTGLGFTQVLKDAKIAISMDGKGSAYTPTARQRLRGAALADGEVRGSLSARPMPASPKLAPPSAAIWASTTARGPILRPAGERPIGLVSTSHHQSRRRRNQGGYSLNKSPNAVRQTEPPLPTRRRLDGASPTPRRLSRTSDWRGSFS